MKTGLHPLRRRLALCAGRLAPLCLALCLAFGLAANAHAAGEDELKAAIIYNLLMFVDWPADTAPPMHGTLALCLPPESRYAEALKTLAEKPVRGLQIQLRQAPPADIATACNALLLEDGAATALPMHRLKTGSVLVIADGADIATEGIVISLQRNERKVSFDLNLASARRARLQLSSKLIRLARGVVE